MPSFAFETERSLLRFLGAHAGFSVGIHRIGAESCIFDTPSPRCDRMLRCFSGNGSYFAWRRLSLRRKGPALALRPLDQTSKQRAASREQRNGEPAGRR
jgi:hypothetical protein